LPPTGTRAVDEVGEVGDPVIVIPFVSFLVQNTSAIKMRVYGGG
jgi:hypothetical protein